MAGFESTAPTTHTLPTTSERTRSLKRTLPNGPCNHRDPAFGTPCGCDQFWDNNNADVYDGSKEHRSSERSTWCVCGHHACMHAREARPPVERLPGVAEIHNRPHVRCDARCLLQPGSQCNGKGGVRSIRQEMPSQKRGQPIDSARLKTSLPESNQLILRQAVSQTDIAGLDDEELNPSSLPSSSGLPPVPSMCLLSHDRRPATEHEARGHASPSRQHISGLGLGLGMSFGNVGHTTDRRASVTSTIPDDINIAKSPDRSYSEPNLPSTGANSMLAEQGRIDGPRLGPLDQILQFNRNLNLATGGDTIPNTYNPDEFIQSATEVATPSLAGTPDLRPVDQAVQDSKVLIDNLRRLASNQGSSPERLGSTRSAPGPQLLLTNGSAKETAQEQLEQAFKSATPRTINKLMAYLQPLHNVLISIPNVTNAIRELNDRMDLLESNSFNHVQPEDFQRQFEMMDGRQLELEHRMDDHDRLHQTIDQDHSTNSFPRRRLVNVMESFTSNHSIQSNTSSTLLVAAIDRNEMETEMEGIKSRLDVLEAAALPTSTTPWEVEVILIPWGRELRGIWFSEDESMHDHTKATTQDSEEWTQMRMKTGQTSERVTDSSPAPAARLSLRNSMPFSDTESGWSSQAISDWAAGSTDDWLSPKACGGTNQVYKRLRSRGFVRDVTLRSASARDIQVTLSNAFSDLLEYLKYTDEDEDPFVQAHPGLRASFVPLRKVHKESKLRFLTPSEMASSALWTAQFLGAGVIMRVTGGKKRLYVTQRESYLQQPSSLSDTWTWHDLRLLPRYTSNPDSQMEGGEVQCQPQVPEADALEPCWIFNALLDLPPPSVHSSFSSGHGSLHSTTAEIAMRPADRPWRRSITPSSILKNRAPQPISPLSENHPLRSSQGRLRTVSAPQVEVMQGSAKRRFNASPVKPSSVPTAYVASRTPSASVARLKRRRVAPSSSPRPEDMHDGVPVWANTPRRSRSPFFSSQPPLQLKRTNSEASRGMGKSTPLAYATPHSGPVLGFGGGDTEPDSDDYQDDGEKSWPGVEEDDDAIDVEGGAEESPSFSGDESGFGSEDEAKEMDLEDSDEEADEGDDEDEYGYGGQRPVDSEEDEENVYDTLLGVLGSQ